MRLSKGKKIVQTLPTLAGCYMFKNDEKILYIGKAKNIRKRVGSYFHNYFRLTPKLQLMLDQATSIDTFVVDTEVEALVLESNLIKKHKPPHNVLLKDNSSYSWIKITKSPYPIIYRTRNRTDKNAYYFGPYLSTYVRDQIYNFLRRQFPFRSCSYVITNENLEKRAEQRRRGTFLKNRLCTYYHIGKCDGPCEGLISQNKYNQNIDAVKRFLKNKKSELVKELKDKMSDYSKKQEYEKAAKIKKQVEALTYTPHVLKMKEGFYEDNVLNLEFQRALKGLEKIIKKLKLVNKYEMLNKQQKADILNSFRIECYDISNLQGTNPVGAMVVYEGALEKKSHYRKFKIYSKETPDDFSMMYEMLKRRFSYLSDQNEIKKIPNILDEKITKNIDESFITKPNLVIIDGGKGQLKQGIKVFKELQITHIFLSSIAKRREEIFLPEHKDSYLFQTQKDALYLLQRIRDETHRFGINFHRQRRSKQMVQ